MIATIREPKQIDPNDVVNARLIARHTTPESNQTRRTHFPELN
jgi:hypothetical protein